ncbi:MAG: FAD-dependent oxidoreductase [Oscillospiraceae bacterium]|jgi:hypothetical protein|nr:FAD-dependent oxidoreductase [Oscillospiraceae bacterium]
MNILTIQEPTRTIAVAAETDVLVVGGGIAGIAAAIAAARRGARVTLIEREYTLGGLATLGLITIYLPLCDGMGRQVCFGLAEELLRLGIKHGAEADYPAAWLDGGTREERIASRFVTRFNPHLFGLAAERLLTELGVTILYGSLAAGVALDGDRITHALIENKSGRLAIALKSVVDCSGDADICALSGADTALNSKGNGLASWYYYLQSGEVKLKMFGLADVVPEEREDNYESEAMTESLDAAFRFSGVDGYELSRANIAARQLMYEDILTSAVTPVTTPGIPLVRMSRRLVGVRTQDVDTEHRRVENSIGMTGDWRRRGPVYELSFDTLRAPGVTNLLAAGRAISVTDALWDITRVIPPCAVTGQAAGTAAALTNNFGSINIAELQNALRADGARLHLDELSEESL